VRVLAAVLLALWAANGRAAQAYVTDELVLGVYAEQTTQGQRLATLHSGASVETLAVSGESTQVRLPDGRIGWVKTTYLTSHEPASVRVKALQDELDRSRATTPALAEAAARSEVERLTRELAARQAERPEMPNPAAAGASQNPPGAAPVAGEVPAASGPAAAAVAPPWWLWLAAVCAALGGGFWLGYAALARRIKDKFGGIKVY
jgi:hypothetical protein